MLGLAPFALIVAGLVTVVVFAARLGVRVELDRTRTLALTFAFVALLLGAWWFLTRGNIGERLVHHNILPSAVGVVRAFVPLHLEHDAWFDFRARARPALGVEVRERFANSAWAG
ncbi:MAG: hypothetical protein HYY24_26880 [Verrucomicrobia bacterium]|nr:hypothetical protein [Verrucomicrobiota bacterium]